LNDICFTFCRGDGSSGVLFGALLFGFGFRLAGPAHDQPKRASD
jgi:hypothetical protein